MRERMPRLTFVIVGVFTLCAPGLVIQTAAQGTTSAPVSTQRVRPGQGLGFGQGRGAGQGERIEAAELQRLFDAYQIMQAQDALQLDDVQFGQFLPKLRQLQETRRRNEQARQQIVAELARLTSPSATADETVLKERLQALQELEGRAAAELRRAYDTVDQQLDVRRQARFRVFEQNMERRKFQLMLRARRNETGRFDSSRLP